MSRLKKLASDARKEWNSIGENAVRDAENKERARNVARIQRDNERQQLRRMAEQRGEVVDW